MIVHMSFFDSLNDALNKQVEKNLDYIRKKARSASDDGLRHWWQVNQYEEGEFADRVRKIVKHEMDKRGI